MLTLLVMVLLTVLLNLVKKVKIMVNVQILLLMIFVSIFQISMPMGPYNFVTLNSAIMPFNMAMVILSIWISMLMLMVSLKYDLMNQSPKLFSLLILSLLTIVMLFFITDSMLLLYITFEASLIPTLMLILKWGYQPERLQASFYFVMYTICASLPLLIMMLKMKTNMFTYSLEPLQPLSLLGLDFNFSLIYMAFMMAFLVKVPMWGVHLWLPKAHVEAPVSGSMILAGVLLKLGGYGIMKINMLTANLSLTITNFVISINMWGALIVSLVCLAATDMKSMIAYSSVIHMNLMVVGILSNSPLAIIGSIFMMIGHGLSSPGMFAMANFNYEMTNTRNLLLQKGLSSTQNLWTLLWFPFIAANMAAPPSLNFASEMLICVGIAKMSLVLATIMGMTIFLSAAYNTQLFAAQQSNNITFITPHAPMSSLQMHVGGLHSGPAFVTAIAPALLF